MLKLSDNQRFLVREDASPFFWLADTAWLLFHRLTLEDAKHYLDTRARQGFNVIQAILVVEDAGRGQAAVCGYPEFHDGDVTRPHEGFFSHVDAVVEHANQLGLVMALLPSWGDMVPVPYGDRGRAGAINEDNARGYGRFLGERYGQSGVVWVLGGDRPANGNEDVYRALAAGVKEGDGGRNLMTYHPVGTYSSSYFFHDEPWLDFNMIQSGHQPFAPNWRAIEADYHRHPTKPVLDGEPCYDGHPSGGNNAGVFMNDWQARAAAYWSVFSGSCGHTYGNHAIWQFYDPERPAPNRLVAKITFPPYAWREALEQPGAHHMGLLRRLIESRPFLTRIPDPTLIYKTRAAFFQMDRIITTRDGHRGQHDATYLMAYFPRPIEVTVRTAAIASPRLRGWWYDPRTGATTDLGEFDNRGSQAFQPPEDQVRRDRVLVLDDARQAYPAPGAVPA